MQSVSGVPKTNVGQVVQDFIDDGAAHVVVELNEDGTYTVSVDE
jgi:hypothetical protein